MLRIRRRLTWPPPREQNSQIKCLLGSSRSTAAGNPHSTRAFSQTLMRHRNWRVWLKMQHGLTVKPAICSYMLSGRCSCVAMPRRRSKKTYSARAQKYQTNLENRNRARDKVKMERSVDVGPSGYWLRKVGTHGENASHIEEGQ